MTRRTSRFGRYWRGYGYDPIDGKSEAAVRLAAGAARRLAVPFVVIGVAEAEDGRWWVIEPNDGQDSGYAGLSALPMWRNILALKQ